MNTYHADLELFELGLGDKPEPAPEVSCQGHLCRAIMTDVYYDAPTVQGPWGYFCSKCYFQVGAAGGTKFENVGGSWERAGETHARKIAAAKEPSEATMLNWLADGVARATDGCRVEPDGKCQHGKPSWFLELGLI